MGCARVSTGIDKGGRPMAHNTFHVALYVEDLDAAIARYRKILGQEPAKVRHDYAKFEVTDPPVILSLNVGRKPPLRGGGAPAAPPRRAGAPRGRPRRRARRGDGGREGRGPALARSAGRTARRSAA